MSRKWACKEAGIEIHDIHDNKHYKKEPSHNVMVPQN